MSGWDAYLSDEDRRILARGRFGRRMGFGDRPAVVVIDCQNYMVGERGVADDRWPSSCGAVGWQAVDSIRRVLDAARAHGAPVFYTRFTLAPDGSDAGVYQLKRELLATPYWCLEGTVGSQIVPDLAPQRGDVVLVKKKPSAFHGTPLIGHLVHRGIDTLIVTGGSTSNCVRATVFDAASHDFRAIVPAEAVFDRIPVSHHVSLFDMDRQFADVVPTDQVVAYLETLPRPATRGTTEDGRRET